MLSPGLGVAVTKIRQSAGGGKKMGPAVMFSPGIVLSSAAGRQAPQAENESAGTSRTEPREGSDK